MNRYEENNYLKKLILPLVVEQLLVLRAAGDVKYTMTISILSMWIFRIAISYILVIVMNLSVLGIWIGMFADWYVRGTFYLIRYFSQKWEKIKVI